MIVGWPLSVICHLYEVCSNYAPGMKNGPFPGVTFYICLYVTGHGILGLMEVLVEIWVITFFESLIGLKYTGNILDLLSKKSQSYERYNDVPFYETFGRI